MNCVVLRVDNKPNTPINVGKNKSLIIETRKKNENVLIKPKIDIEKLLVKIYYRFYFSKRRNLITEYCAFCD